VKLWMDGSSGNVGHAIRATIKGQVENINRQVMSRGVRVVNILRNAELEVLKGQRSGNVYRKPHTKRATYRASAPGEPPARRTGNLRLHWNGQVEEGASTKNGKQILAVLESQEKYAAVLEEGTKKTTRIEPRPFVDKIKEKAIPEIKKIYQEPYN
jgi:hypothetical protein